MATCWATSLPRAPAGRSQSEQMLLATSWPASDRESSTPSTSGRTRALDPAGRAPPRPRRVSCLPHGCRRLSFFLFFFFLLCDWLLFPFHWSPLWDEHLRSLMSSCGLMSEWQSLPLQGSSGPFFLWAPQQMPLAFLHLLKEKKEAISLIQRFRSLLLPCGVDMTPSDIPSGLACGLHLSSAWESGCYHRKVFKIAWFLVRDCQWQIGINMRKTKSHRSMQVGQEWPLCLLIY